MMPEQGVSSKYHQSEKGYPNYDKLQQIKELVYPFAGKDWVKFCQRS